MVCPHLVPPRKRGGNEAGVMIKYVDPDVAKVCHTPEAVNDAQRAILHAIPGEIK
jgi:hypothetical protein